MRRRERANVVVLSSEEKYCYAKAAFDPVIDYLAGLSSPAFYAALQSWREIVRNGMKQSGVCSTDATAGPDENSGSDDVVDDESDSDAVSEIEPADLIDTMRMIREMEQHDHNRSVAGAESRHAPDGNQQHSVDVKPNSHSSDRSSFTAMKTLTQTWEPKPDPLTTESASPKQSSLLTKAAVKPNNLLTKASAKQKHPLTKAIAHLKKKKSKSTTAARKNDKIEVLQLPIAKPRHNQLKKLKQARMQAEKKPQTLAAITLPDKKVPVLSRVLEWVYNTSVVKHVREILVNYPVTMTDEFMGARSARSRRLYVHSEEFDYNFVVPKHLVTKLNAVVEEERNKRSKPSYFANDSESEHSEGTTNEIIASFSDGSPKFTSGAVYRIKEFYNVRAKCEAWFEDMKWLLSTKWANMLDTPELFDEETDSD
ncbi:hypothetical protein Pcac1_g3699 [Phytophthora cactorum]|uniref:Uncharacterized protein n=3 Tax=Phytophthora cactorum TaxID=29920 RepID=A0A8T0Y6N9_9STRA|nr:hypothetical protein Pcac1_g3699 [Phytophthora cactorum]KAG2826508.1 hypothetical protein PC113_g21755 [Phytophthora cactorum]KAG2829473.1 hypothetical protein PC111_g7731 [Phytophthora cactorum]KAG2876088.1 hypothetical protein PC114_g24376 [Phytophthora cactorum]KAG2891990.1 hypothetical protein PC117_g24119 [Phytophthora cactorum]